MRVPGIALLIALSLSGCGKTLALPGLGSPFGGSPDADERRVECEFMTVLIDYSRNGDVAIAERLARAMADEFEALGTRVTSTRAEAFWSLMILATRNGRPNGFVFSATLSARNMHEGYDPGVIVFRRDRDEQTPEGADVDPEGGEGSDSAGNDAPVKIPTMYSGLSFGHVDSVEQQGQHFVRQAYAAVFPYAEQLCQLAQSDREREESLERQLPGPPEPL